MPAIITGRAELFIDAADVLYRITEKNTFHILCNNYFGL